MNEPFATKDNDERPPLYHARMSRKDRAGKAPTQGAFASEVGIHPVTLAKLEKYGVIVPGKKLAGLVGRILGRSPGEVIDDYQRHVGATA